MASHDEWGYLGMIEVDHLSKSFGGREAIKDVSFRVQKGEILGFLGPNGAGKTTTMRILTCYMPATAGTARVAGYDVFEQSMEVRRRVGYLPEEPPLYDEMTVRSYLEFAARIKGVPRSRVGSRVDDVAGRCGLGSVLPRVIGHLSRGFRQRVGLAQALIHDPEILILDEPTIGLDPAQIIEIREVIRSLRGDRTIIFSTHILPEVTAICSNVVIINEGRAVVAGPLSEIAAGGNDGEPGRQTLLLHLARPSDVEASLSAIRGVSAVALDGGRPGRYSVTGDAAPELRERIAALAVEKGWGLLEMTPVMPTLEEIYMNLIAGSAAGSVS